MTESTQDEKLLDHEYDGIQELDNSLPQWWLYGFYFTCAFAVVYLLYYHLVEMGPSMEQEYLREMAAAGYRAPPVAKTIADSAQELGLGLIGLLTGLFFYLINLAFRNDRRPKT